MTGERVERRLAAVLAADVAGYSRLMGIDEEGTLARLKAVRKALVDPTIAAHRGRIVKTTGDGMLVEFSSAVDAVRGAVEVQRGMADQNVSAPQDQRIEFRIGIHVGDIIIDDNDIFGDGVNVAARVENACEPGAVYVSGNAFEQIRGKTKFAFDDLGDRVLKNIEHPVRLYAVRVANSPVPTTAEAISTMLSNASDPLPLPDKPSIAVLPFQNMSGDPEQEYFADGLVEDLITALTRAGSLFVIARNSSFTYKGKHVDIRQVGRELGVRYVLEGSIRKSGNRVRITGQLIEAANGNHIWADKFEGGLDDVFELQDRITETVVAAVEPSLQDAEIRRSSVIPTTSLHAYDLYLRALSQRYGLTRENLDEAIRLIERAIALDPDYAFAKAFAASVHTTRSIQSWATPEDIERGKQLAHEALISSRDDSTAIAFAAHAMAFLGRENDDIAIAAMDRAIHLNPNSALILTRSGHLRTWVSDADRAVDHFSRALRLNPVDPEIGFALGGLAIAFLIKGEYDRALEFARRTAGAMPRWMGGLRALVVAAVKNQRLAEAQEAVQRILRVSPDHSLGKVRRLLPYRDESICGMYMDSLRLAGLPE